MRNGGDVIHMRVNIEAERARMGYTKQQMCNALGITLKTYNSYIHGGNIPSRQLILMHELFNCSIDYLLSTDRSQRA